MLNQTESKYHHASRGENADIPELSTISISPTYQEIKELCPRLSEDTIMDLLRIHRNNTRTLQLGLQQAHQDLSRHRIRKPGSRCRALTDGMHRSALGARHPTDRKREIPSKRATVTDIEDEARLLRSSLLQGPDHNRSASVVVGEEESVRGLRAIGTQNHAKDRHQTSDNMDIDSDTWLGSSDSSFANTIRALSITPGLVPGTESQRDNEGFATSQLVEALLDNTACVDTEEPQPPVYHDSPMS